MAHAQAVVLWSPESGGEAWRPTTLRRLGKDEAFLEEAVAATPQLLGLESRRSGVAGPFKAFRQASLSTPSGRGVYPDVVFLTGSGHVVVVEAKPVDNPELRDRAVIAQILDYASSFAALSDQALLALFRGSSAAATWAARFAGTASARPRGGLEAA